MTLAQLKKKPLLMAHVKKTDTDKIVEMALQLANEHPYYRSEPMGVPARFVDYLKESEPAGRDRVKIKVPENSVYEEFRFAYALEQARKTP